MNLTKLKPFFLGVGIIGGAVLIVYALMSLKPKPEKEENAKPPLVVRTAQAISKNQTVYSTFQGEVRAKTDIELVTQVTGKVTSLSKKFLEGGEFAPGETLIQIDKADYQVALKSAEASVASAQVDVDLELATAKTNAKEWMDLQGRPIEEANPLRLNKPQIDRAKARLNAAKAELAAARLNYDRTNISAPFAGRIMTTSAELGQFMSRGSSIGRVFATDIMEVRIPMTDVQISELGLSLGYSALSSDSGDGIPATVSTVFGDQRRTWDGVVQSVDASVDNETRLLYATVVVDKPFQQKGNESVPLVPGLFVDVEIASPTTLSGLELPRTALRNGNQVYVYQDDKLMLTPVRVIYTSQDVVIVEESESSKLNLGQRVITSSVPGAYEGMPIKLTDDEQLATEAANETVDTATVADSHEERESEVKSAPELVKPNEVRSPNDDKQEAAEAEEVVTPQSSSDAAVKAAVES